LSDVISIAVEGSTHKHCDGVRFIVVFVEWEVLSNISFEFVENFCFLAMSLLGCELFVCLTGAQVFRQNSPDVHITLEDDKAEIFVG
jgi:hypothetical protein